MNIWCIAQLFRQMGAGIKHEISMMSPLRSLSVPHVIIKTKCRCAIWEHLPFPRSPFSFSVRDNLWEQCGTVWFHSCGFADRPATLPYLFADEPARLPKKLSGEKKQSLVHKRCLNSVIRLTKSLCKHRRTKATYCAISRSQYWNHFD